MAGYIEDYKGLRIAVYKTGDGFVCCVYTGAFGYHIVQHFEVESGLSPSKLFKSHDEAVSHAKAQIDSDRLRA